MGIPKFVGGWLGPRSRRDPRFRGVFLYKLKGSHDSLAIDMNGVIHNALAIAMGCGPYYNEEYVKVFKGLEEHVKMQRIFDAITMLIVNIVDEVAPRKTLVIAVDGPIGRAKLEQQRGRRYKSAATRDPNYYDTSIVTPGTPFMIDFDEYFRRWMVANRSFLPPQVFYSSHLVPGEGEHKIMEMYRKGEIAGDGEHVLYGLDADLVMLAMLSPLKNIKLVREDFKKVINIERLKEAVIASAPEKAKETAIHDFVILSYLLGNDFLPHGPTHNSMDRLFEGFLNAYVKANKPLAVKSTAGYFRIDYSALSDVLENFGETEAEILGSEASAYALPTGIAPATKETGVVNRFFDVAVVEEPLPGGTGGTGGQGETRKVFDYGRFRSAWYTNELGVNKQIAPMAPAPTEEDIADMCYRYLYGMAWVFRYYQVPDTSTKWYYSYYHAPLHLDMIDVIKHVATAHTNIGKSLDHSYSQNHQMEYGAMEQLFAVIPPASFNSSIPSFLHAALKGPETPLAPFFPIGIVIEMDGIEPSDNYLAVPIVPRFDMDLIIKTIKSLNIPPEIAGRWSNVETVQIPALDTDMKNYAARVILNQDMLATREAERLARYGDEQRGGRGRGRGDTPRGGDRGGRGRGDREGGTARGRGDRGGRGDREGGTARGRGDRGTARGGDRRGRGDTPRGGRGGRGTPNTQQAIETLKRKIRAEKGEREYPGPEEPMKPLEQAPKKYYNTHTVGPAKKEVVKETGISGVAGGKITREFDHMAKSLGTQYDRANRYYDREPREPREPREIAQDVRPPARETPGAKTPQAKPKEELVQLM